MMESGVRMYGGQTSTAVEIEKKRMWKFDRFRLQYKEKDKYIIKKV